METKNIVIDEKSYEDLVTYNTKYNCGKKKRLKNMKEEIT